MCKILELKSQQVRVAHALKLKLNDLVQDGSKNGIKNAFTDHLLCYY